jgi:phosphodiesterase/alkaline phosphatase D-like protein
MSISRRKFIEPAASFGASLAFRSANTHASIIEWRERRDLYPKGVASGDPQDATGLSRGVSGWLLPRWPPAEKWMPRPCAVEFHVLS